MLNAIWTEPVLEWADKSFTDIDISQPQILELSGDTFLPDFMQAMKGTAPDEGVPIPPLNGTAPSTAQYLQKYQMSPVDPAAKLFQPLHGKFYLVVGSLICRQVNLPDWDFQPKKRESVFYVVRRIRLGGEEGWDEQVGRWTQIGNDPFALSKGILEHEERLPLHPVKVKIKQSGSKSACDRQIYYGYIPTGARDKYLDKLDLGNGSTVDQLNAYANSIPDSSEPGGKLDFRAQDFMQRVSEPWKKLIKNAKADHEAFKNDQAKYIASVAQTALNITVSLGDFLFNSLNPVWHAIKKNNTENGQQILSSGKLFDAYNTINSFRVPNFITFSDITSGQHINIVHTATLGDIFRDSQFQSAIEHGAAYGKVELPSTIQSWQIDLRRFVLSPESPDTDVAHYRLFEVTNTTIERILNVIKSGLRALKLPGEIQYSNPETLLGMIKGLVRPIAVDTSGNTVVDQFVIRMVYEYDPDCPVIISTTSTIHFMYAPFFDPDAPARMVRIEMPSINPADLRKFTKGVGIQMSKELNNKLDAMHPGMMKGDPPNDDGLGQFTMVCTFSIQIIMLVALIVMFIFLLLLNIVFQWIAFLRICLPIPKKVLPS